MNREINEMSNSPKTSTKLVMNAASQMSFSVAACALGAAAIGSIVNHWMTGWMAVGGMVGVGLFYLVNGLLNLRVQRTSPRDDHSLLNVSQRTAKVENLYAERILRPQFGGTEIPTSNKSRQVQNDD